MKIAYTNERVPHKNVLEQAVASVNPDVIVVGTEKGSRRLYVAQSAPSMTAADKRRSINLLKRAIAFLEKTTFPVPIV